MEKKIAIAVDTAYSIMEKHNVTGWSVVILNGRKTLAVTDHAYKTLELNKRFIYASSKKDFEGIITHEVAHMILGPGYGHGKEFVQLCKKLGAEEYSGTSHPTHIGRYLYACESCHLAASSEKKTSCYCRPCLEDKGMLVKLIPSINRIKFVPW